MLGDVKVCRPWTGIPYAVLESAVNLLRELQHMSLMKTPAKSARIWFSKEHTSKSNPGPHTDTYRKKSNESKPEKISHNPAGETKIPINKNKG
jgi:hypothetical protein